MLSRNGSHYNSKQQQCSLYSFVEPTCRPPAVIQEFQNNFFAVYLPCYFAESGGKAVRRKKQPQGLFFHCYGHNTKGRSEESWGWESPWGIWVEGWRHIKKQSPGDILVSVSPIQGTVQRYQWQKPLQACGLSQCWHDLYRMKKTQRFYLKPQENNVYFP